MKEEIKLTIHSEEDRKNIITALANSGYSVRVERIKHSVIHTEIQVIFKLK